MSAVRYSKHGTGAGTAEFTERRHTFTLTNLDGANRLWFAFDTGAHSAGADETLVVEPNSQREVTLRGGSHIVQVVAGDEWHIEAVS